MLMGAGGHYEGIGFRDDTETYLGGRVWTEDGEEEGTWTAWQRIPPG